MLRSILVLLLLLAVCSPAWADSHSTIAAAYQHAQEAEAGARVGCSYDRNFRIISIAGPGFRAQLECAAYQGAPWVWNNISDHLYPSAQACVSPAVFDPEVMACRDPAERCRGKNSIVPDTSTLAGAFGTCVDGCMIGERESNSAGQVDVNDTSIHFGKIGFTGETCTGGGLELPDFDTGQTCTPAQGGNMTVCVKPDGRHCYSASTGRQICWQPGETGTKTDGPVAQTRGPGLTAPTPPAPPPGETFSPGPGNPTPATTTTPGGNTINTTTINSTTNQGTNAGSGDGGEPADGSGSGSGEGDDGDGDGGTASGGETCAAPPTCSESSSIGCAILHQQWRTRCTTEEVTGGETCATPPSACQGANCMMVHYLWRIRCADPADAIVSSSAEVADSLDGVNGGLGDDPANAAELADADINDVRGEQTVLPDEMFGDLQNILPTGVCPVKPSLQVAGLSLPFNFGPICDLFINLGQLVLMLAYLKGAQIYMGSK